MASTPLTTFLAVSVPCNPKLREALDDLRDLGSHLKLVSPNSLHITVKYLGETTKKQQRQIEAAMESILVDVEPFEVEIRGVGVFPNTRQPSVLWAGVAPSEPLTQIATDLEAEVEELGYSREQRDYHPHLTLARVKRNSDAQLTSFLDHHRETEWALQSVSSVELFQSVRSDQGVNYVVLKSVSLV